jgi:tetratricopeptide (TPR) repeat protein
LGAAFYRLGRYEEAIYYYKHAIQLDPESPRPYHNLAMALYCIGRYEDAFNCYKETLQRDQVYRYNIRRSISQINIK